MATKNKLTVHEKQKLAAELLQKGETEEKVNNYKEALEYYQQAGKLGSSEAIKNIGNFHRDGHAVEIDYKLAMKYYQKSAKLGNAKAMNNIGALYFGGKGVKKDDKKSKEWFKKAFSLGRITAFENLEYLFEFPESEEEFNEAIEILNNLAGNGNMDAMFILGNLYSDSSYGNWRENNRMAKEWLKKAAKAGHAEAMYKLSQDCNLISYDIKKSFKLCKKAAEAGCVEAMFVLSEFYSGGYTGFKKNEEEEYKWLERAAEKGDPRLKRDIANIYFDHGKYQAALKWYLEVAKSEIEYDLDIQGLVMNKIAQIYYNGGDGVETDYIKAKEWFEKSGNLEGIGDLYYYGYGVEQDYYTALYYYQEAYNYSKNLSILCKIGDMFYYGQGVKRNLIEAKKYYELGEEHYEGDARCKLGNFMYKEVVINNYQEAIKYHRKAAKKGNAKAMYYIGCFYEYGKGVKENRYKAIEWYEKAAELGESEAMVSLGEIDYENRKTWYEKAAKLENPNGIFLLCKGVNEYRNDCKKRRKLYGIAIKKGSAEAAYELSREYERSNKKLEMKYLKIAANMGYKKAMSDLCFHYNKIGNSKEADKWKNAMKIHIV